MNYYNTNIPFKYELLKRKIFRLTLVLSQDMDAEPCKNYELKGDNDGTREEKSEFNNEFIEGVNSSSL